jgi:tRNA threonylcarbamoyladenosine biosynthesis protein TsaE
MFPAVISCSGRLKLVPKWLTSSLNMVQVPLISCCMPQLQLVSHSPHDHAPLVGQVLEACKTVRIFAFFGPLGAGKTTLIKGFCTALGVTESVTSPTFALVNSYHGQAGPVHHFDLYRLKREEEAYDIGLEEYLDSGDYVFIEWPERIPTLLPPEAARLHITVVAGQSRHIELTY